MFIEKQGLLPDLDNFLYVIKVTLLSNIPKVLIGVYLKNLINGM